MGACTSSIGTWMQEVAQNWLVLELTNSAKYLALDAFLGELPLILFTLIGGVVADRQDRRKVLLISQVIQMASAFTLAGLVLSRHVEVWHVLVLSFVTGCAQAFGGPAYQSLIPSLVRKEHLPNAIALNSIQFNIARVLGPLLAAAALHAFGTVACFGLNGLSFLVVIAALLALRPGQPPSTGRRMLEELGVGLGHVWNDIALLKLTVLGVRQHVPRGAAADVPAGVHEEHLPRRRRPLQPADGLLRRRRDCRGARGRLARTLPPHGHHGDAAADARRRADPGVHAHALG